MDCAMGTFLFLPILPGFSGSVMAIVSLLTFQPWLDVEAALAELTIIPAEMPDSSRLEQVRNRLPAGGKRIRTAGPPWKRDGVFRGQPNQPPAPSPPRESSRGTLDGIGSIVRESHPLNQHIAVAVS